MEGRYNLSEAVQAVVLAERIGAKPVLQREIAAGVARITAAQTVDTMVHTAPGIVSDVREGKKVTEIGLNALKAEGEDLGLNIGSELVLDAAGIAVKKVVGAVRGGTDVSKFNVDEVCPQLKMDLILHFFGLERQMV